MFISEYVEGSSNNKAIELHNPSDFAIDLSLEGYTLEFYFNGNTVPRSIPLTGIVAAKGSYVIADDGSAVAILAVANQIDGGSFFNGDDAVVLRKGGAVVDAIGQIGVVPAGQWGSGAIATRDKTLRRIATVLKGDAIATDPFDPALEWEGYAQDTFSGLGTHTTRDATPPTLHNLSPLTPVDDSSEVSIDTQLSLQFNEAIQRGLGDLILKRTVDSFIVESFDIATSNLISISGDRLILDPSNDLEFSTAYHVELEPGAVKDLAGNSFLGFLDATTWNFTTMAAPPSLLPDPVDFDPTEPNPLDPNPTDPDPTEPDPTEPNPLDPNPTDPNPTEPNPVDPAPIDLDPTEPEPVDPAPIDLDPTEPEPVDSDPTEPDPTDPSPKEPNPTDPDPTNPAPTQPDPTEPEPDSGEPVPTDSAPMSPEVPGANPPTPDSPPLPSPGSDSADPDSAGPNPTVSNPTGGSNPGQPPHSNPEAENPLAPISGSDQEIVFGSARKDIPFSRANPGRILSGSAETDVLKGTPGSDIIRGGDGGDRLLGGSQRNGHGKDRVSGNRGDDWLWGGKGKDWLDGGQGDDVLIGGKNRDLCLGGNGGDRLLGQGGNDILVGGHGDDRLNGGRGRDMFTYTSLKDGTDTILQFNVQQDLIDLRQIFTAPDFSGESLSKRFNAYVDWMQVGANTHVRIDADGSNSGQVSVTLAVLKGIEASEITSQNFVMV